MAKKKFQVVRPWYGVNRGDTFEAETVHPALASNVVEVVDGKNLDEPETPVPPVLPPAKK